MDKRVLLVAATDLELEPIKKLIFPNQVSKTLYRGTLIESLATGVGSVNTVWSIMDHLFTRGKPSIIINVGIAGSFNKDIGIGDLVVIKKDVFADLGIEEQKGFSDVFAAGLADPDEFPFKGGKLYSDPLLSAKLTSLYRSVSAITVNSASGTESTISGLTDRYHPDIETMESAAVLYVAAKQQIPAVSIRSISNFVEPRNKDNWNINEALNNLGIGINKIFEKGILI